MHPTANVAKRYILQQSVRRSE